MIVIEKLISMTFSSMYRKNILTVNKTYIVIFRPQAFDEQIAKNNKHFESPLF